MSALNTVLKWAGNKRLLAPKIISLIGEYKPRWTPKRIVEPFMGAGGFFVHAKGGHSYLASDNNGDLISMYRSIKLYPRELIKEVRFYFDNFKSEEEYYEIRRRFNFPSSDFNIRMLGGMFIFLNRHGFNGLCRYNQKGEFNVPYGKYKSPYFPEKEILEFSELLQTTRLINRDFRETLGLCMAGDLVYCDPPYIPKSATSSFTGYSGPFTMQDQLELKQHALEAVERGCVVVLSNSDTEVSRQLYSDAKVVHTLDARRSISANGDSRKNTTELVVIYG
jgi:DNA adenine methylase